MLCFVAQKHICKTELKGFFAQTETFQVNSKSYVEHSMEIQNQASMIEVTGESLER